MGQGSSASEQERGRLHPGASPNGPWIGKPARKWPRSAARTSTAPAKPWQSTLPDNPWRCCAPGWPSDWRHRWRERRERRHGFLGYPSGPLRVDSNSRGANHGAAVGDHGRHAACGAGSAAAVGRKSPRKFGPSDDMKQTVSAIMLLIVFCHVGCTSIVTRETLMRRATRHSLTLWPDTTYYCGSRRAFDYFYIQPAGPWHVTLILV